MAKYRQIQTCFWDDSLVEEMNTEEKIFYLFLLTGPNVKQCGCYTLTPKQISNKTDIDKKKVEELIRKFENEYKSIKYSSKTKEILILNFHKYNWTSSPKVKNCIMTEISEIKEESFKSYLYAKLCEKYRLSIDYVKSIHSLSIDYPKTIDRLSKDYGEEEKEKEKEKEKGGGKKFATTTSPSFFDLQSIVEYGLQKGVDEKYSKRFFDYYEKKKWMCGKTKIEDWRVKFDEWITEDEVEGKDKIQTNQPKQVSESAFTL